MSKSKIFIQLSLAFALGIFVASRFILDLRLIYLLMALAAIILAGAAHKRLVGIQLAGWLGLAFSLGILRYYQTLESNQYRVFFDQNIKWEGYVVEDPDVRMDRQLVTIRPKHFNQRLLVTTTKNQDFFYGDWVTLEGKLKAPTAFENFDYPAFLERYGVYAVMSYPKILVLKNGQGNPVKLFLLKLKHSFSRRLQKFLPQPQSSLALGILIGAKRGLPADVAENFNITGTSHIVAISGFNIAVIVAGLNWLAWLIGRRANLWLSALLVAGFVFIAGAGASVVRAAVMGGLLLLTFNLGRLYSVVPALCLAGTIMLYINPKILYFDVGFQLSFAATLGLVLFMPLWDKLTQTWPKLGGLKNIFFATVSAIAATLPLVLWYFGRLSLVALLANLLILPVVPLAMLFGFLTIVPAVAPGFAFLANLLLSYVLWVVSKLAHWPLASVIVEINAWTFMLMVALLIAAYFGLRRWANGVSGEKFDTPSPL